MGPTKTAVCAHTPYFVTSDSRVEYVEYVDYGEYRRPAWRGQGPVDRTTCIEQEARNEAHPGCQIGPSPTMLHSS
jgi:hypothetical protein